MPSMEQIKEKEAASQETAATPSPHPTKGHDGPSKVVEETEQEPPEADYSSEATNKAKFTSYLVKPS